MPMGAWTDIAAAIATATGKPFSIDSRDAVGGGCINAAYRVAGNGRTYFVKTNSAAKAGMFAAEAAGLTEIDATNTIRVPRPICHGANRDTSWLVVEFIELRPERPGGMRALGRQLAALHRKTQDRFGWDRDNTIGSTPQINTRSTDWVDFFRERRLGFQLELAKRNGYAGAVQRDGARLMQALPSFFKAYTPRPALLHGDLWSGNAAFDHAGTPVVFDPAVYYGDREADVAMTELFGGFSGEFYEGYREAFPLDPGYAVRRDLYNLYHVLNHLNLFSGSYLAQAERLLERLLATAM
jgi:protein-ribulosamine 3-kinase